MSAEQMKRQTIMDSATPGAASSGIAAPIAAASLGAPAPRPVASAVQPVVSTREAGLAFGDRVLWSGLDLDIPPGQFVAILGSNGSGKTSLIRVLLGEQPLSTGEAWIAGEPVRRGSTLVGYVPQKVSIDSATMVKARDVVRMGLDGHRWGMPIGTARTRHEVRRTIDELLASVGAAQLADAPVSMLSGGELQRVRVAAALASNPSILLCDEPLAALDLRHQQEVAALLDRRRREHDTAVLFVTHDINAVLDYVDQVLYLAAGRFRLGPPEEVLTSEGLTELYGAPVDVIRTQGRVIVVASTDPTAGLHLSHDDHGATDPPAGPTRRFRR
jgi:zinc/manganese transport system ATP-binding protein